MAPPRKKHAPDPWNEFDIDWDTPRPQTAPVDHLDVRSILAERKALEATGPALEPLEDYTPTPRPPLVISKHTSPHKRSGKTPEARVTEAGNKYLASIGALTVRINQGTFKVVDPSGKTRYISGPPAGTHDWLVCLPNGRFMTVEYKATTTPTDAQLDFQRKVLALNGLSIIVRDVDRDLRPVVERELSGNH